MRVIAAARAEGPDWVLEVRVQPRASRTEFAGLAGERLRVRLNAPPVDGRANAALVDFVAQCFGLSRARVTIDKGLTGRDKRLRVRGPASMPGELRAILGQHG